MKIRDKLLEMKDTRLQEFNFKLTPNIEKEKILGINIPKLRKFEKTLSLEEKTEFLVALPHKYLEENILHGIIISNEKDLNLQLELLDKFVPFIDNWLVCDTITIKRFADNPNMVYEKINCYLKSKDEYILRFAIVNMLRYFLDDYFRPEHLYIIANIESEYYYVKMAIAWYYSIALIKQYEPTIKIFEQRCLNKWIHNKALQKARESLRVSEERKEYFKSLKLK